MVNTSAKKWSPKEKEIIKKLNANKAVNPSKVMDRPNLKELGIMPSLGALFVHGGLGKFLAINDPTYVAFATQFVASFVPDCRVNDAGDKEVISCNFGYEKTKYTVPLDLLRDCLRVTKDPTPGWSTFDMKRPLDFWFDATRSEFRNSNENNNRITHPALRLASKLLTTNIHGHSNVNRLSQNDFCFTWCLTPLSDITPCWVTLFFKGLSKIQKLVAGREIHQGTFLTSIALGCGITFRDCSDQPVKYSFELLHKSGCLATVGEQKWWLS